MPIPNTKRFVPALSLTAEYMATINNSAYGFQTPPFTISDPGDLGVDIINFVMRNTTTDQNMIFGASFTSHNGGGAPDYKALAQAFVQDGCVDPISGFVPWFSLPAYGGNPNLAPIDFFVADGTPGGIIFPPDPPPPLFPLSPVFPSAGLPSARGFVGGNEDEVDNLRNIFVLAPGQAFCHGFNVDVPTSVFVWGTFFFSPVNALSPA